jgi:hypothetical protein
VKIDQQPIRPRIKTVHQEAQVARIPNRDQRQILRLNKKPESQIERRIDVWHTGQFAGNSEESFGDFALQSAQIVGVVFKADGNAALGNLLVPAERRNEPVGLPEKEFGIVPIQVEYPRPHRILKLASQGVGVGDVFRG